MYHLLESLVRWLAPILSFTAEEIWSCMPGARGESVFLETWHALPEDAGSELTRAAYWEQVLAVRTEVARELERARVAGVVGSSLDAEVDLYCAPALQSALAALGPELRFALIVSEVRLHSLESADPDAIQTERPDLRLRVAPSAHAKCGRCWHHRTDVGADPRHPALCARCVANVEGPGEERRYV
jgi:isoleucyl-tRNA synthetase